MYAATPEAAASFWVKYRALSRENQLIQEFIRAMQMDRVEKGVDKNTPGPYEYTQKARERIKAGLAKKGK